MFNANFWKGAGMVCAGILGAKLIETGVKTVAGVVANVAAKAAGMNKEANDAPAAEAPKPETKKPETKAPEKKDGQGKKDDKPTGKQDNGKKGDKEPETAGKK